MRAEEARGYGGEDPPWVVECRRSLEEKKREAAAKIEEESSKAAKT